ncbi:MAG: prolyl oligopeptidase family serine peptidase [Candidatus Eremiobacteraeota bacterium]|nr:prolyl oligopeptidase family serine peptidase [Candidatus Eremiobacteraeota bacterium]
MKSLFAAVLSGLVFAFPLTAGAFSMDDVLSAPYISHLSASPDGRALVWAMHVRGSRNLFVTIGGKTTQLTSYDADDGQEVYDPQFLAGNEGVVYQRGDNGGEANPNPLSLVEAPERTIYVTSVRGGTPVSIGTGIHPVTSPADLTVAWEKSGALQITTLQRSGGSYKAGTVSAPSVHGTIAQIVWSPDGSRLALVNRRGDHSFVQIYTLADKQLVYATPDFTNDGNPVWSLDSTRIAFTREPGSREGETPYTLPSREPWSLWVADARSGSAKKIWQARRGTGSEFYGVDGRSQLWWLANDRIAFPWEGSGWRNLYSVSAAGGAAKNLTPGKFETEMVSAAVDGSRLFYAANENAIDERHIWQVRGEGPPQQLSRGPHNQWRPAATADGVAYLDAGYKDPPVVMVSNSLQAPATQVSPPQAPNSFPGAQLVQPKLVTFRAADGLLVHGQLFVPKDGKPAHAGLIFTHGGSERQMLAGFHYMEAYTTLYESNQFYANHGFVVLSINYRSGIMYGHDFRDAKHVGYRGASEYQDVLAGATFLKHVPTVDGRRIGLYGLSYGGYLTALGLARNSDIFKAGVDFAGVHNWATIFDEGSVQIGTPAERRIALLASPEGSLAGWRSPVFLSQGDDDRNVPFSQGVDLATRLRDRGVNVQTMVFPNETHENLVFAHTVQLYDAAARFLIGHLVR